MTTLNLSGQQLEREDIQPKLQKLKGWMNERKVIWDKLPPEKKQKWIKNASQVDPIMDIAWDVYKYLLKFFDEITPEEEQEW